MTSIVFSVPLRGDKANGVYRGMNFIRPVKDIDMSSFRSFTKFNNSYYHFNKLTLFPMLQQMGYSSLPVIAPVLIPFFL